MTKTTRDSQSEEAGIPTRAGRCAELKTENIAEVSNASIAGWLRDTGKGLERCALHDDEYHKSVFASSQWGVFGELIMKIGQP
ncbi:MAG: hypothetical protein IT558_05255, partial [Alphaproteobacteria bacterium]|nr:hypothetical protein [Alphaproteobacteria bacterium]